MFFSNVSARLVVAVEVAGVLLLNLFVLFGTGCAASTQNVQLDRIENKVDQIDARVSRLESMPPGTQEVVFVDTQDRNVDTAYLPVAAPATNTGTCRWSVDGVSYDTADKANSKAKSTGSKVGTHCFKKDRLDLGPLTSRELQIGK